MSEGHLHIPLSLLLLGFSASAALAQAPSNSGVPSKNEPGRSASERVTASFSRAGLSLTKQTSSRIASGGVEAFTQTPESLRWRLDSDGSWIAQAVSLGDHGAQVFAQYGSFINRVQLFSSYDVGTPTPAWGDGRTLHNFSRQVRSSEQGDLHIALHQEYADSFQVWRHATLRKYSSSTAGAAEWSYTSPLLTINDEESGTALSADGQTIVLLAYNVSTLDTQVTVFAPDSAIPVHDVATPTFGAVLAYDLSADGSTLALISSLKLVVLDIATASVVHEAFLVGTPQFGALALSGDGALLAFGTLGEFSLLERDTQGTYGEVYSHTVSAQTYCRRIEVSEDGSTLVAGLNVQGAASDARIISIDIPTAQVLFDTTLSGSGNDLNLFEAIECSSDGTRFAVGLWGDSDGLVPQVLAFRRDSLEPLLVDSLVGSVLALDLSADGTHLAIASKGTHAMQWGGSGSLSLYRVGRNELSVSDTPHSGATITLEHRLREGIRGKVLVATALAATPTEVPGLGSGLLYLDQAAMWELPLEQAGSDLLALSDLDLVETFPVGTSLYIQALDFDNLRLTKNWVKVTVLP